MNKGRWDGMRMAPLIGGAAFSVVIALGGVVFRGQEDDDIRQQPDAVVLIGSSDSLPAQETAEHVALSGMRASPEMAASHVKQVYPLFSDVTLLCQNDKCILTATLEPPNGQPEIDRRQAMLTGGLAATLGADGYILDVPFQMDEVDDNKFHVKAMVTRSREP